MTTEELTTRARNWRTSADGVRYPPEPWYLGGTLLTSVFRVPIAELPDGTLDAMPARHRLVAPGNRATVGVSFARYTEGGVLAYDELLVALATHCGGSYTRTTIAQIWVDSEASMHGGRELWGIPKGIGAFDRSVEDGTTHASMSHGERSVASLEARTGGRVLPGRRRIPLTTAQTRGGHTFVSRNLILGKVRRLGASWTFATSGPLSWLADRSPSLSFALTDAAIVFGQDVARS